MSAVLPTESTRSGWHAELEMIFAVKPIQRADGVKQTQISHLRHRGPLRVQRPFYPEGETCHVYLLHPPAGIVGGDSLHITIAAQSGTHALLTTPGAARFYRSAGDVASVQQHIAVHSRAIFEWFPQENIFFAGSRSRLNTKIALAEDATFFGWEINCLGRPANAEPFSTGRLSACLELHRNGRPVLYERQRVHCLHHLHAAAGLRGYPMQALFMATGVSPSLLAACRRLINPEDADTVFAMTLLDDILLCRALGHNTEQLQQIFIPLWQYLRARIIGKAAMTPRIWAT